ncbi:MAG: serine--tRNA ligase [Pseudonocardiaceae bacterium]
MLDKRFIREHPDAVKNAVRVKGVDLDVDELLELDEATRKLQHEVDQGQARKKAFSRDFAKADEARRAELRAESAELDAQLKQLRDALTDTSARLDDLLLITPNIPWDGSPIGPDESANVTITTWGQPPEFDFPPLDHVELAEKRGWAEFARARKVAGERAYALTGDLLMLERAVHSYALDLLTSQDFTPISVPALVKEAPLVGSGMFPKGREEIYELPADDAFLAGTAEVALVGLHSDEILDKKRLPIRYAGISPCFRREIGSASRDVRGLLRVHQFEKVEQFVICEADAAESARWHAELLASAQRILQDLGLHYEVVECATGDMGLGKFRMNDINTWFPSLGLLRETHSCSTLHDWQARRANLRYRDSDGKIHFAHTLNNTAVATPRLLAALIENHQTKDHEVRIPAVLRTYLKNRDIL